MTRQTVHIIRESRIPDRIHGKVRELKRQFLYVSLLALGCIILTSCSPRVYYNSIKPLSPEPKADFEDFVRVDSQRPTFRWEPILSESKGEPDFYEFGIWIFLGIRRYDGKENLTIFGRKDSISEYNQYYGGGMGSTTTRITANLAVVVSRRPYYTKGVKGCAHTIGRDLIPDTKYVWSVRPGWRTGDRISFGKWATYNSRAYHSFLFISSDTDTYRGCAFPFITPVERDAELGSESRTALKPDEVIARLDFPSKTESRTALGPGEIIFKDNFDDNSGNWSIMDTPEVSLGISQGKYVMTDKRESGTWFAYQRQPGLSEFNFEIECDVKHTAGVTNYGYGITFGLRDAKNTYNFLIDDNGRYIYGKILNNKFISIIPWTQSSLINQANGTNRLAVRRKAQKLEFIINGQIVNSSAFEYLPGDRVGFMVECRQTVEFDNLIVRKIE